MTKSMKQNLGLLATCLLLSPWSSLRAADPESLYPAENQRLSSPGHTTYYVDPAEGDDARSGLTPKLAWRTFRRVNQLRLAPGDRLVSAQHGEPLCGYGNG